jgi:hypothetical protein
MAQCIAAMMEKAGILMNASRCHLSSMTPILTYLLRSRLDFQARLKLAHGK